jgi:outer membrane protein assembly factor BamB
MFLVALGVGIAAGACTDAAPDVVTDPIVQPDSVIVASIEMLPAERQLSFVGMSDRLGARRILADGTLNGGSRLNPHLYTWSSNAPDVVKVDSLGVVTALREGTARITATSAGFTGTATVTVRNAIRVGWSVPFDGGSPGGSPGALTIGDDGTIYASTYGTLYALAPGGQRLWSLVTGAQVVSAPAIAPDGTLYVGTGGTRGSLMAVDRAGAVRWTLENIGWIVSSPAIGMDGTVYAASRDRMLYAVDAAGRKKWEFEGRDSFVGSSPAIARDGTIVVGAYDGNLYAVSPSGTERWTHWTGDTIRASPAIASDGTIYIAHGGTLAALTPGGDLKWGLLLPLGSGASSSPAIGSDGTVYVGGDGLHAVDPGGRLRWAYKGPNPAGTPVFGTPIVAGDGTIFAVAGGSVHAVAADGSLLWDYPNARPGLEPPVIGVDGTILVAGDRTLHAIVELDGSNGGFANAPWPKARGDRGNTGRAGGP